MEEDRHAKSVLQDALVADLTQALAGPYLGMLLGDLGADVVKLERPGTGDQSRGWGPPFSKGESSYFMAVNRNKRSLTCNFKTEEGGEVLRRLVNEADVVLTNERRREYRVRMGIDYESLSKRNPGVVYCSITGFGMSGPYEGRAGYDIIAQGMGGMMPLTGLGDDPPLRYPASIADLATAMYGLSSILAALLVKERTGRGQYIDLALVESQAWWSVIHSAAYFMSDETPERIGNDHPAIAPYGAFKAKDGYLIIACGTEAIWQRLCSVLGLEEMMQDPRYRRNRDRVERREEVTERIEGQLADETVDEVCRALEEANIPSGPIYNVPDMLQDEHMQARGFVIEQDHPVAGTIQSLACPIHLSKTSATYRLPPPLLGQHTDEVLEELGYTQDEIEAMHEEGAV
ncbi:MAG: CaiB/BaiF CoA transferase family protein [Chloroflexota bacterium]